MGECVKATERKEWGGGMRRVKKAPHSAKLFFLAAAAEGGGGRRRGLILSPPPPQKREYLAASIRKLLLFSEIRKRDFLEKLSPAVVVPFLFCRLTAAAAAQKICERSSSSSAPSLPPLAIGADAGAGCAGGFFGQPIFPAHIRCVQNFGAREERSPFGKRRTGEDGGQRKEGRKGRTIRGEERRKEEEGFAG